MEEDKQKEVKQSEEEEEGIPVEKEKGDTRGVKKGVAEDIPALSKEAEKIIESVEKMTVLELHTLVKALEKRFGVSAQAVAVAAAPGASAGAGGDEEKSIFTIELKSAGAQKIQVIKAVKELLGLGLKEAKDMVDGAPSLLKEGVKKADAEEIKAKIEKAGGSVELK